MERNRTGHVSTTDPYDPNIDASGKSFFWRFVAGLNKILNPGHAWTDYQAKRDSALPSLIDKQTGANLTNAEQQANAFNAEEAQKQREWEEYMSNTAYQRQVKDMQAAGINPAMAMNANGASTPSGSSASSVSPQSGMSFSDLMQLLLLPMQRKLMNSQASQARAAGEAALITARANERNAGTNERNAGTNEQNATTQRMDAETRRMLSELEKRKTDIYEGMTEEQRKEIAERAALLKVQREQLPAQLAVAQKNADSQAKSAIASLRQAEASVQNAATNDRLADYETSLRYAQEMITWADKEGRDIVNRYLDERQRTEISNLAKEGIFLDKRGELVDRQGKLVSAQTVKTYVNVATDVSGAINQWINPLSSGTGSSGMSYESANATIGLGGYGSW